MLPQYFLYSNCSTLQMKGRWESNINVWFSFMNSQKWNCAASLFLKQNYNVQSLHSDICERFIYFPGSVSLFCCSKYVDWSWVYNNRSQTHECGNGTEPVQFTEKEYINRILVAVYVVPTIVAGTCSTTHIHSFRASTALHLHHTDLYSLTFCRCFSLKAW
jgi:hypothetical protein